MISPALSSKRAIGLAFVLAAGAFAVALVSAEAAQKKAVDKKDEAAKPSLVASFGDWNVFTGQAGKGRICYALAQPKSREPASLKRDPGYAFISDRPEEGVRNEVSFIMGFDILGGAEKPDAKTDSKADQKPAAKRESKTEAKARPPAAGPVASVDEEEFELLPKGADLWVKNAAREGQLIAAMRKGAKLQVRAASLKGHESTDTFSLAGFGQAMDRLQKECPGK